MKKITKTILVIIVCVAILGSVGLNVYWFGWIKVKIKYQQEGFNSALQAVVNQVQQTGEVKIGEITLIQKQ